MDDALITSLTTAVEAAPNDLPLRLHLADLLVAAGRGPEAVAHVATVLANNPASEQALALMAAALAPPSTATDTAAAGRGAEVDNSADAPSRPSGDSDGVDWASLEADLGDAVPPMFADGSSDATTPPPEAWETERSTITLADVGGLDEVKKRLHASFLAPLHNPELRRLYGKSLRGGLLLYGPPGCGKTFLARAVAGELGASFLHVSLADVLDMYIGQSERNVAELFAQARASAPCVLFLDELDAIGQKRSLTRNSGMRTTVNQLLTELDGVATDNEGLFVLAATNHPWDVDPALRRPGRLDRTLLVLPPDRKAREAIMRSNFAQRPVERIDVSGLAKKTEGFSGADLAHLVDSAAEIALMDSVSSGTTRMITMADVQEALGDIRPSVGPWLETARNVALYANESGEYDELAKYIRKHGRR